MKTRSGVGMLAVWGVAGLAGACGGPNYHFDAAPAPAWTRAETGGSGGTLTSAGAAPATLEVQRDLDLATRDAKEHIAQMFNSQVSSRATDWAMAVTSTAGGAERTVTQQTVDVKSNVKIEDVVVKQTYRDETSKMQYVQVDVDRAAWARKLHARVAQGFETLAADVTATQDALVQRHPFSGLKTLLAGQAVGKEIEPDIIVIDLLDPQAGAYAKLTTLKNSLAELNQKLRQDFGFTLQLSAVPKDIAGALRASLEQLLKMQGFAPAAGNAAMRIEVNAGEKFIETTHVANRQEQVHGATGALRVFEPDGKEVPDLAVTLSTGQNESDVDAARARSKALSLAADTLVAKFRSAFRKNYVREE